MHREILDKVRDEDYEGIIDSLIESKGNYSLEWISWQIEAEENIDKFKVLQEIIGAWEKKFGNMCNTSNN